MNKYIKIHIYTYITNEETYITIKQNKTKKENETGKRKQTQRNN